VAADIIFLITPQRGNETQEVKIEENLEGFGTINRK
jgi:hypothetical protein